MNDGPTDPNDRDLGSGVADTANPDGQAPGGGTDDDLADEGARSLAKKRRAPAVEVLEALERILSHAEANGEVYHGAVDDHGTIRAYMTDQYAD